MLAGFVVPGTATAAPPDPSAAAASTGQVAPGNTFTVAVELFNPQNFTVTGANAQLRTGDVTAISSLFELVSCAGAPCFEYSPTSYRGVVGDLAPGAGATVVFTLRVRDTAPLGDYTFEHQFVGSNFSFAAGSGPAISIVGVSQVADIAVGLDASPRGILTSRVTYTVSVTNNGPADAAAVRVAGTYAAGFSWAGGDGCARVSGRNVVCDVASLPSGATAQASFSVNAGLLALGSFSATATRTASTPSDPDGGNDSARRSCSALTGLLVRC
ncbi:COG1361 family protein [Actinophytocola sp. KF-1]